MFHGFALYLTQSHSSYLFQGKWLSIVIQCQGLQKLSKRELNEFYCAAVYFNQLWTVSVK